MATGSQQDNNSKGFDFASDDNILCSYEDHNNNIHRPNSDSALLLSSPKEFDKNRTTRPMFPPACSPPEESFSHDVAYVVENTMKKYTDNVMRFLEGLSSRLSQLELYCYNIDKSVGEMRSDLERDHNEGDLNLRTLNKHLQEVYRCVRILQEKQDFAETQKELAKLQLEKRPSSGSNSQLSEDRASPKKATDTTPDTQGMQLALVPPQPQSVTQPQAYYVPAQQVHYIPSDPHYQHQQMQAQSQPNMAPPQLSMPQCLQQQWVQQLPQQKQQMTSVHSSMQTQVRPQLTPVYSQYPPTQLANSTPESMQLPGHAEATSYVYVGPNRTMQQQAPPQKPPQQMPSQQPQYGYLVYEGESARPHNPLQHQQSHFPHTSASLVHPPQFLRGHPHSEVIEKLVNMGYRVDHVANVIQRLEESGQPVDFNAVLDRLTGGWAG